MVAHVSASAHVAMIQTVNRVRPGAILELIPLISKPDLDLPFTRFVRKVPAEF